MQYLRKAQGSSISVWFFAQNEEQEETSKHVGKRTVEKPGFKQWMHSRFLIRELKDLLWS